MINIRYHIVSITAIFLALGIGTLLGSTFLDRATVDQLDRNIRNAEARIADTEGVNDRLNAEVDAARARDAALIEASESLLDGQLTDRPVLLVVAPGVDQGTVDTLRRILANADAELRGSLTLRDDLTFADGIDGDLAEALGVDPDDPEAAREEVTGRLVEALVAAGAPAEPAEEETPGGGEEPGAGTTTTTVPGPTTTIPGDPGATTTTTAPTTTTTTTLPEDGAGAGDQEDEGDEGDEGDEDPAVPDGDQPDIVSLLVQADLIGLDPGPANTPEDAVLERTGYRYVYVTQTGLDPASDDLLLDLLPSTQTDPPLPAVVVSATPDPVAEGAEEPPPSSVGRVRADPSRAGLYSTVDDIDTYLGLSSTVTILRADEGTAAGHYGQGEGAMALAPGSR